jgi:hypothetical protein
VNIQPIAGSYPLSTRWTQMRYHATQVGYASSPHRFNIVPAGRRSGKTELAKRKLVQSALRGTAFDDPRYFAAAPTRDQAKKIYWNDLKTLTPREFQGRVYEGDLIINMINGSQIHVVGMDKPERIEGQPWDGCILDEYGNMKEKAWPENVRPALSDRKGWADFIGVPEGRNHYYELYLSAQEQLGLLGDASPWGVYEWESKEILDPEEIEAARKDLHPLVFEQEYGGKFVDFSGVAILDTDKLLVADPATGKRVPVPMPERVDAVFAVIDTAVKTGKDNDGTAVIYFAVSRNTGFPLVILDWDTKQIEGALLETWLPTVFSNLEQYARLTKARSGSLGAMIEDKTTGSVLIQQSARRGWPGRAIPETLTALGKDERAISVSGYVYQEKSKITQLAYDKVVMYKGAMRNHLLRQIQDFRIGDKDAATRADDLLDCFTYGVALALGNAEGF